MFATIQRSTDIAETFDRNKSFAFAVWGLTLAADQLHILLKLLASEGITLQPLFGPGEERRNRSPPFPFKK